MRKIVAVSVICIILVGQVLAVINSDGEKGVVRTLSGKPMGKACLNVGAGLNIFQSRDYVDDLYDGGLEVSQLDMSRESARMISSNVFLGVGITKFWDAGMSLPFYYDWLGYKNVQDGGIGDLEFSSKFLYPNYTKRVFYQSYFVSTTIPTGMQNAGLFPRHPYFIENTVTGGVSDTNPARTFYSSEYPTVKGLMLWTWDLGNAFPRVPVQIHVNLGGVVTSSIKHMRNTAVASAAIEYAPIDIVSLFVDFHSESRWSSFSSSLDPSMDPVFLSPGIKLSTPSGIYLSFVSDFSLSSRADSNRLNWAPTTGSATGYRYSTGIIPAYGVQFVVGWNGFMFTQDDDRDKIPNSIDRCPSEKEDYDGFQDDDGCPDKDNDGDGVLDVKDKCPNDKEDMDGFQDDDGCPDPDNDGDGIADTKDQCPNKTEDNDGFQDQDGCPDLDNDNDGITDSLDRCPNSPEDIDGFEDSDGCPDIDNDQDGVPDQKDKCPNVSGTTQNSGCPADTVKPVAPAAPAKKREPDFPRSQILNGVDFRKGTTELSPGSDRVLDQIVQKLREYPELEIEVHGHTEGIGNFTENMQISQMRAETVRQYMVSRGVEAGRIRAVGFGSSSPVAENKTAAGRAQNRRIEVIRIR
ncbi:MAG: OmpA family protein [Chitinispirillaceae bacterium]|jgi:outer membrane protein OmpA-like peptidoglycan-associated protein|nr:OmpA family protein [Chitinispirillaceae bacterium]